MVYYSNWEAFEKAATEVFANAPGKARYTVKYRNCDAALVLKITDDATCVQMRTEKLDDIKRIARIQRRLGQIAANRASGIKEMSPIFPKKAEAAEAAGSPAKGAGSGKQQRGKKTRSGRIK
ncbi:Signal recognition particle protein [Coemansia sp. RSA 552]|nr:Signal recognition particle protein [Coemansia sp. RSA 552]